MDRGLRAFQFSLQAELNAPQLMQPKKEDLANALADGVFFEIHLLTTCLYETQIRIAHEIVENIIEVPEACLRLFYSVKTAPESFDELACFGE
jgi:hypothetical protein